MKNRPHQGQQKQSQPSDVLLHNSSSRGERNSKTDPQQRSSPPPDTEAGRPPSSQFIPYVRTNEVYYLDPDAPVTRPSTHDPQYRQLNGTEMYCELIHVEEKKCYSDLVQSATIYSVWCLVLLNFAVTHVCHSTVQKAFATKGDSVLRKHQQKKFF